MDCRPGALRAPGQKWASSVPQGRCIVRGKRLPDPRNSFPFRILFSFIKIPTAKEHNKHIISKSILLSKHFVLSNTSFRIQRYTKKEKYYHGTPCTGAGASSTIRSWTQPATGRGGGTCMGWTWRRITRTRTCGCTAPQSTSASPTPTPAAPTE